MKDMVCRLNDRIIDAIETINKNAQGVVFVIDENEKLVGLLTDGDIRRCLLANHSLSEYVHKAVNRNFTYFLQGEDYLKRFQEVNRNSKVRIKVIPIVTKDLKLVDYFRLDNDIHLPVASPELNSNRE